MIEIFLRFINTYIIGTGLPLMLFFFGIIAFFGLKLYKLSIKKVCSQKKFENKFESSAGERVSPVSALLVALAGTLGVGNIAGVASAIYIGGAGAVFWMLLSALAAMPIKYAEIVLAVRHRLTDKTGRVHGGAFYYINDLGIRGAKFLSMAFGGLCLMSSLFMGCALQSNAVAACASASFNLRGWIVGVILAFFTLICAMGGLSRISFMTNRLIPLMSIVYIIMCLYIIFANKELIFPICSDIIRSAFDFDSFKGAFLGIITSKALRVGVTRGVISNEAGCGTAPIAHSGANTKSAAYQGLLGMVEVFVDTIVICTLSALVVLIGVRRGALLSNDGMTMAINAFGRFIPFANELLFIAVLVFAFCTIICWFYYGSESLRYLFGEKNHRSSTYIFLFVYTAFVLAGSIISGEILWSFSDFTISLMTIINVFSLFLSFGEIKKSTDEFYKK